LVFMVDEDELVMRLNSHIVRMSARFFCILCDLFLNFFVGELARSLPWESSHKVRF
jgi:hypothetical protein